MNLKASFWWQAHFCPETLRQIGAVLFKGGIFRAAEELTSCHSCTKCPLPSQFRCSVPTAACLLPPSPAVSPHHSSVSFTSYHFLYKRRQPTILLLITRLLSSIYATLSFSAPSFAGDCPTALTLPQHNTSPAFVIQGDLQLRCLSWKTSAAHFLSFRETYGLDGCDGRQEADASSLALVWQGADTVWGIRWQLGWDTFGQSQEQRGVMEHMGGRDREPLWCHPPRACAWWF